jgi:transposase-like protein
MAKKISSTNETPPTSEVVKKYASYTEEQKRAAIDAYLLGIQGGFEAVQELYKNLGIGFPTLHKWCAERPEYQPLLEDAKSVRAIGYALEAKRIMDDCNPFYDGHRGNQDSMPLVTLAKNRSDICFRFAGALDPGMWGDMAKEVRELQKEIKKLQEVVKGSNAEMFGKITQIVKR